MVFSNIRTDFNFILVNYLLILVNFKWRSYQADRPPVFFNLRHYSHRCCRLPWCILLVIDKLDTCSSQNKHEEPIKTRSMSPLNTIKFKHLLDQIDFTEISQIECPDEAYNKCMQLYKSAFNSLFPLEIVETKYILC